MIVVLKGHDRAVHRFVAVKVLDQHIAADNRVRARFLREARAWPPSIAQMSTIYHVSMVRDRPFLVMEHMPGTLRARIKDRDLKPRELLMVALGVARGLVAAHAAGVFHRDIKPENILLGPGSRPLELQVKIADFGLALAKREGDAAAGTSIELARPGS